MYNLFWSSIKGYTSIANAIFRPVCVKRKRVVSSSPTQEFRIWCLYYELYFPKLTAADSGSDSYSEQMYCASVKRN